MRLPDEIIVLIFKTIREGAAGQWPRTSAACDVRDVAHPKWMQILRVCTRWRSVAMSSPTLWNRVALHAGSGDVFQSGGDYPTLFLTRAAGIPLEAYISSCTGPVAQASEVFAQISRIRHLYVLGNNFTKEQLELLKGPAPQLQTLVLDVISLLPSVLFYESHIPSLRSLCLNLDPPHFAISCQNLRQLQLGPIRDPAPEGSQTLFAFLQQTCRLEDLSFSIVCLSYNVSVPRTPLVYLPMLKRLKFDSTLGVDILLRWFRLPDGVCLSYRPSQYYSLIFPFDRSQLGDLQHLKRLTLTFREGKDHICGVFAVGTTSAFQTVISNFELGGSVLNYAMDNVEELWLEGALQSVVTAQQLEVLFFRLPLLQRVVMTVDSDAALLRCLEVLDVSPDAACHCPFLHDITIRNPHQEVFTSLARVLASRRDAGHPIRSVQIDLHVGAEAPPDADRDGSFSWWKEVGRAQLLAVGSGADVELVETASLPRMRTVPICHWRSSEAWDLDWPTWGGLHDPPVREVVD